MGSDIRPSCAAWPYVIVKIQLFISLSFVTTPSSEYNESAPHGMEPTIQPISIWHFYDILLCLLVPKSIRWILKLDVSIASKLLVLDHIHRLIQAEKSPLNH
jgi:hypothetical protein